MQSVIVMTGFCEPNLAYLLYNALKEESANWQLIKGGEIYRELIMKFGNQNEMSRKCLLMAAQQLTMAQLWQAVKERASILVDLSWIPKCNTLPTDLGKLKKRAKTSLLWLQGVFRDVEQYKQGMRDYSKTDEYQYLFAKNIKNGYIWLLKQGNDHRALYYDGNRGVGMEIPGGRQTKESVDELFRSVVSTLSDERNKMKGEELYDYW